MEIENESTHHNVEGILAPSNKEHVNSDDTEELPHDTSSCGFACCQPYWMQVFASKKCFTFVYSLVAVLSSIKVAYIFGTLSTIEKNFKMSAKMLGLITSAFEVGCLVAYFSVVYFIGKGNKIRWISCALLMTGICSLFTILPHFMDNDTESNWPIVDQHQGKETCNDPQGNQITTQLALSCFLVVQLVTGISSVILKTSGYVYLDNNTRKNAFPILFSIIIAVETLGSSAGYMISSYFLKIYVHPNHVPNFTNKDQRWIGAWWLGWIPIAITYFIFSAIFLLFPRTLPRAAMREKKLQQKQNDFQVSFTNFATSFMRIIKNKLVLLDILNQVCTHIAHSGYGIFLPKYLETQYGLTSSSSSFFMGIAKLAGEPTGILFAGLVLSTFKPKPRTIVKCSAGMRFVQGLVILSLIFIACPQQKMEGNWQDDNRLDISTECNIHNECSASMKYSPVCNVDHKLYFYSLCHAGCSSKSNIKNTKTYHNCTCVPNSGSVTEGPCPTDCTSALVTFLLVTGLFSVIAVPIRSTRKILRFRFVNNEDKSLFLGLIKILPTVVLLTSSLIYGSIIDGTCMIFEATCNKTGYCLLYNVTQWRYLLNSFSACFLFICSIIEILLWYRVKDLKMYDEDFQDSLDEQEQKKTESRTLIK